MIRIGLSPDLIHVGSFMVTWHSFITAISVVIAVVLIGRWAKQSGLKDDMVSSVAMWAIPGGIIGARLVHVIDNWGYYSTNPGQIIAVWSGGIAIYGAIAGGVIAGAAYAAWKGFPVRRLLDISAPGLIIAQGIGRIGDLINGEHFSTLTDLPWGVVYTHPVSPGYGRPPTHPAVGYEMLADFALFGLLWVLRGRLRPEGSLFALYAALYGAIRFPLSFLRLDSNTMVLGLNQQAWISLLVLAGAVVALLLLRPRFTSKTPSRVAAVHLGKHPSA